MSETKMSIEEIEEIINEDVASMRYRNRAGELVTIRAFLRRVQERMAELEKGYVKYHICMPSDLDAGIHGFEDEVVISIHSGDPGGDPGEFEEWMCEALSAWYDNGTGVGIIKQEAPDNGK